MLVKDLNQFYKNKFTAHYSNLFYLLIIQKYFSYFIQIISKDEY